MDFEYTLEQGMLRDTLAGFLADRYGFEARQAAVRSAAGWRPEIWQALARELDVLGAGLPESLGGQCTDARGGAIEHAIVMEEFGKALALEPYLGTAVIGGGALQAVGGALARDFGPRIVGGEAIVAFAHSEPQARYRLDELRTTATAARSGYLLNGRKSLVLGGPWATQLLVSARSGEGMSLFLLDADTQGVRRRDYPTFDGGRACELILENVAAPASRLVGAEGAALPLLERLADAAICALCAEAVGAMRRMHADTVSYALQRKQFGQPLAMFQVLAHRIADMFVALEQTSALALVATLKLGTAQRAAAASAAKVQADEAGRFIGQAAIQIHGGMGITEELPLGHYFKRLTAIGAQFGDRDYHLQRYADLTLAAAA